MNSALLDSLTQMAGDNPMMKQLVSLYQTHQATQTGKTEELEAKYKKLLGLLRKYRDDGEVLSERMKQVEEQLADIVQLTETLASALGACPVCFGKTWSCHFCHGKGKPGTFDVDRDAFEELILPLFKRKGWPLETVQQYMR